MLYALIVVLLILALLGSPVVGWTSYGWGPSGGLGLIIVILLVLMLLGRL